MGKQEYKDCNYTKKSLEKQKKKRNVKMILFTTIIAFLALIYIYMNYEIDVVNSIKSKNNILLTDKTVSVENDAYISSAKITKKVTGTGPFDSNDEAGNDSSADNNIVRSFDQVTWTVEANMQIDENANVVNKTGGIINIEAILPENCIGLMHWDVDSMGWANGTGTISNDGRTFSAQYQMSDTVVTIPGKQTLVLVLKVDGAPNGLEIKPEFILSLEGNTEKKVKVEDKVVVSAAPRYNVKLVRNGYLANKTTVDYGEGDTTGRMYGYGLLLQLYNTDSSKGLKGIEYPKGDITFDINLKLTRTEFENTVQTDITEECTPILWNYKINQATNNGNISGRTMFFSNTMSHYNRDIPYGNKTSDRTKSTYQSGNIQMLQSGSKINVTISDYGFDGVFPTYSAYTTSTSTPIYGSNIGCFNIGYFQIFVPDNEASTVEDRNYYLTVSDSNFYAQSISGVETSTQQITSDDSNTVNHVLYRPGTYHHSLTFYNTNGQYLGQSHGTGDAKATLGQDIFVYAKFGMGVTNDYNAYSATKFIKFDGDAVQPQLERDGSKYKVIAYDGTMTFNVWYVTKTDGTNWTSQNEMNNANIEDMLIYENIEDIPEGYICVGEYFESIKGYLAVSSGDNNAVRISLKVKDSATIGKTYGFTQTTKVWNDYVDRETYSITKSNIEQWPIPTWSSGNRDYIKTEYDENGEMISGTHSGGWQWGQTLLVIGANLTVSQKAIDEETLEEKTNYDIGKNEYDVIYEVTPKLADNVYSNVKITDVTLKVENTLPEGLTYVAGSSSNGEPEITENTDGTTTLVWYIYGCNVGEAIEPITFKAHMDEDTNNGEQYENKVVVSEVIGKDGISKIGNSEIKNRTSTYSIQVINLAAHRLYKETITPVVEVNGVAHYRITYINKTDTSVPDFQLLDILPYNEDERGTSFNGTYTLKNIDIKQIDTSTDTSISNDNLSLYITNAESVREGVKAEDSNLGTSPIWEKSQEGSTIDKSATAFAVIGIIPAQTRMVIDLYLQTDGNKPLDSYQNNVAAQTYANREAIQTTIVNVEPVKRIIEGKVWLDKNKNGIIDAEEKYLEGIEVILVNSDGSTAKDIDGNNIESITTDANGYYKFENLVIGDYKLKIKFNESNYELTEKEIGTNQETNSKFDTDKQTDVISKLNSLQSPEMKVSNVNAGLVPKDAKVIVHHYKEGTTEKLSEDVTIEGQIDDEYKTVKATDIPNKYELVEVPTNAEGTMTENQIEVIYYYSLKDSAGVIVHHVDIDTNKQIAEDEIQTGKVGDNYTTKKLDNIPANYTYLKRTDNYEGILTETQIEVIYYYQIATPVIESKITKTGTETLKLANDEITYTIEYSASLEDYIGKAEVTIVDVLPYEIDESKSNLAGGIYDKTKKTITWNSIYENIDTYLQSGNEITISKEIKVVYKNVDLNQAKLTNEVTGTIKTVTPENTDTTSDTVETQIDVLTEVKVNKKWVETTEAQKAKRPEKLTLVVKNGNKVVAEKTLNVQETMTHTFTNLAKYDENGNIINYTVDEKEVNEKDLYFYTTTIEGNTITNTFTRPEDTTSVTVNKTWVDTVAQKAKRPEQITLVVKNGDTVAGRQTLDVKDTMSYEFKDLAKYDVNGKEIVYTVDEEEVIEKDLYFYKKTIKGNTITNTFSLPDDKIELEVNKIWTDSSKEKRPETIILQVLNGTKLVASKEVTALENTSHKFSNLAKYDENGNEIEYKVAEKEVKENDLIGYTTEINGNTITNTIKKVPYTVEYYYDGKLDESETELIEEEYGNKVISYKDKIKEGYKLVKEENLPLEISLNKDKNIIRIYYEKIPAKVVIKYLEEGTEKELEKEEVKEGFVLDEYETSRKTISGYETVGKEPENAKGKMTEETIEVIYYYKPKDGKVTVKYLEEGTKKELVVTETINGKVFQKYQLEAKEIEGYELTKVPQNAKGEIKEEEQEVIYYYKALPFDMKVEKYIEKVIQNGKEIKGNKENGKLVKVEIDSKNIEKEEIKIVYAIKIKNTGKVAGTVGIVEDYIPKGLEFVAEDNEEYWVLEGTKVKTTLENEVLEQDKEIELTLVLRWKESEENIGIKVNSAQISNQINKFGFKDIDNTNDIAQTEILIAVQTGEKIIRYGLIILVLTLLAAIVLKLKRRS